MTPDEIDARSRARARGNRIRFTVLAILMFIIMLTFGVVLQVQHQRLESVVRQQCLQRQINVTRSNQIWADLGNIEAGSRDDAATREERLRVYRNAHLDVPICT